jgi:hypothetical protein
MDQPFVYGSIASIRPYGLKAGQGGAAAELSEEILTAPRFAKPARYPGCDHRNRLSLNVFPLEQRHDRRPTIFVFWEGCYVLSSSAQFFPRATFLAIMGRPQA